MNTNNWTRRLLSGAIAGIAGGLGAALVMWLLVEPALSSAIALEHGAGATHAQHTASASGAEAGDLVTRLQQQVAGAVTVCLVGALLGLAFAVVYARSQHRMPGASPLGRSMSLAALSFVVLGLVPAILVPANPPGVGDPDTVNHRSLTYLSAILLAVALVGIAFVVAARLRERGAALEARWIAVSSVCAISVVALLAAFPAADDPIPAHLPADLIWNFRTASLAQAVCLWAILGLVHGLLTHRSAVPRDPRRRTALPRALAG